MQIFTHHGRMADELGDAPRVFIPTMGALHDGHASLIRIGADWARAHSLPHVVVSIFVNPTQFNDPGDLARYPRTLDADARLCEAAGATAIYAPGIEDVYPAGPTEGTIALPEVAFTPGLEDAHRPGHFAGVCQVVARLFELVRPVAAVFGEKDWQQLQVVTAMVDQLGLGVRIIPGPTVREANGLAMSSRNRFLGAEDRSRAGAISAAIKAAQAHDVPAEAEAAMARVLVAIGARIDYAVVRDATTLLDVTPDRPGRAIIAARLGNVRLLDNAPWPGGD